MKNLFFILFYASYLSAQTATPIEELYKDLPLAQRIEKRIKLADQIIRAKNDTPYPLESTSILYALNIKEDPKHPAAYIYLLNKIFLDARKTDQSISPEELAKAESIINQGLKHIPTDSVLQIRKIQMDFHKDKNSANRSKKLEGIRNRKDLSFDSLMALGLAYFQATLFKDAREVYLKAETLAKTEVEKKNALNRIATASFKMGHYQDCIDFYLRAKVQRGAMLANLGSCYNSLNKWDEALAIVPKLPDGNSYFDCVKSTAQAGKGAQLFKSEKYSEADKYLTASLNRCSASSTYHYLASSAIRQKNKPKALEYLKEGAKIHKGDKSKYLTNWISVFNNDPAQKKTLVEEALKYTTDPVQKLKLSKLIGL